MTLGALNDLAPSTRLLSDSLYVSPACSPLYWHTGLLAAPQTVQAQAPRPPPWLCTGPSFSLEFSSSRRACPTLILLKSLLEQPLLHEDLPIFVYMC